MIYKVALHRSVDSHQFIEEFLVVVGDAEDLLLILFGQVVDPPGKYRQRRFRPDSTRNSSDEFVRSGGWRFDRLVGRLGRISILLMIS